MPSKMEKGPRRILWCFAEFSDAALAAQALNTLQVGDISLSSQSKCCRHDT